MKSQQRQVKRGKAKSGHTANFLVPASRSNMDQKTYRIRVIMPDFQVISSVAGLFDQTLPVDPSGAIAGLSVNDWSDRFGGTFAEYRVLGVTAQICMNRLFYNDTSTNFGEGFYTAHWYEGYRSAARQTLTAEIVASTPHKLQSVVNPKNLSLSWKARDLLDLEFSPTTASLGAGCPVHLCLFTNASQYWHSAANTNDALVHWSFDIEFRGQYDNLARLETAAVLEKRLERAIEREARERVDKEISDAVKPDDPPPPMDLNWADEVEKHEARVLEMTRLIRELRAPAKTDAVVLPKTCNKSS